MTPLLFVIGCWPKKCKQLKNHKLAHLSSAYLEYWSPASTSLSPPKSRNSLNKADNNEVLPLEAPPGVAIWQLTSKNHFSEFWHYLLPVWVVQREGRKICLWSLEGWNIQFLFFILTWYHNVWNLVWCQEKDAFEKRSTGWSPRPTPSSSSSSRRSSLQWWRLWGGVEKNAHNYSFVLYFCPTCLRLLNWETQRCHEPLAGWGTLRSAIWGDKIQQ